MTSQLINVTGAKVERWPATTRDEARGADLKEFSDGSIQEYLYDQQSEEGVYGTVATYLSHTRLMKHVANDTDDLAVYVAVEDDAKFNGDVPELFVNLMADIKKLPKDWDVYHFGFWGEGGCNNGRKLDGVENICRQGTSSFDKMGNLGYAMNPRGARMLLKHLKNQALRDVDGAMMPNFADEGPETYTPMVSMMSHGGFGSDRSRDRNKTQECEIGKLPKTSPDCVALLKNPLGMYKSEWEKLDQTGWVTNAVPQAEAEPVALDSEAAPDFANDWAAQSLEGVGAGAPANWETAMGYQWPGFGLKKHVRESSHDQMLRIKKVMKKKKKLSTKKVAFNRHVQKKAQKPRWVLRPKKLLK